MKIASKRVETEAMQWVLPPRSFLVTPTDVANKIVRWINENGGEANYWPGSGDPHHDSPPLIRVRTNSGWASVPWGWWVIRGSEVFWHSRQAHADPGVECLDHYPCDPATFAKRWDVES